MNSAMTMSERCRLSWLGVYLANGSKTAKWCRANLIEAGLIRENAKGHLELTEAGRALALTPEFSEINQGEGVQRKVARLRGGK